MNIKRLFAVLPSAVILGAFFSLPQVSLFYVIGSVVLGLILAFIFERWVKMPRPWIQALSVNALLSAVLAIILLIQDLRKPFPPINNWGALILEACGLMLIFLIVFALSTGLYSWIVARLK